MQHLKQRHLTTLPNGAQFTVNVYTIQWKHTVILCFVTIVIPSFLMMSPIIV